MNTNFQDGEKLSEESDSGAWAPLGQMAAFKIIYNQTTTILFENGIVS